MAGIGATIAGIARRARYRARMAADLLRDLRTALERLASSAEADAVEPLARAFLDAWHMTPPSFQASGPGRSCLMVASTLDLVAKSRGALVEDASNRVEWRLIRSCSRAALEAFHEWYVQ
jgi:hypothetical protein